MWLIEAILGRIIGLMIHKKEKLSLKAMEVQDNFIAGINIPVRGSEKKRSWRDGSRGACGLCGACI